MTIEATWILVVWAALAGLDLVSVLQGLLSRPIVAGTGAGLILGDVETGIRVGAILELFAMDVVPVGSAQYPDFSAATVGAVLYATGQPWATVLGAATGVGLLLAILAGRTMPLTRRANAWVVGDSEAALSAGSARAVSQVHWACLANDGIRSSAMAMLCVGAGWLMALYEVRPSPALGEWLTVAAIGGGIWAAVHGVLSQGLVGNRWLWVVGGAVVGVIGVALW